MKIKSSPILGTIGLLYGIFTGSVIAHTITKDHYEAKKDNNIVVVKEYIYADDIPIVEQQSVEIVFVEPAIDPSVEKKIPNDLTKRCPQWEDELKNKGFPVKFEMADHVYSEIQFNTRTRCNPCDKTCDYSIVEAKIDTETELCPRSSNNLFDQVKDIFYPKRCDKKGPEPTKSPIPNK